MKLKLSERERKLIGEARFKEKNRKWLRFVPFGYLLFGAFFLPDPYNWLGLLLVIPWGVGMYFNWRMNREWESYVQEGS